MEREGKENDRKEGMGWELNPLVWMLKLENERKVGGVSFHLLSL